MLYGPLKQVYNSSFPMDALIVENNIESDVIKIVESSSNYANGDEALIELFKNENYHAVATDDAKLVRQLRVKGIPFILPGLIIYEQMGTLLTF